MASGHDQSGRFADLPPELFIILTDHLDPSSICHLAVSRQLQAVAADGDVWRRQHEQRWRRSPPERAPIDWRAEYIRRNALDSRAEQCIRRLATAAAESGGAGGGEGSAGQRQAWSDLLALGEEVLEHVAALTSDARCSPSQRMEAETALLGLNQSIAKRAWIALLGRAAKAATGGAPPPAVEEGSLLLMRFYRTVESLQSVDDDADQRVLRRLDQLAHRLASRLQSDGGSPPPPAVSVVRALSEMMFQEDKFGGNTENYYDYRNSLLDCVLDTRLGIPITLSVIFAAVCSRVGVELDSIGLPGHFLLATRPPTGAASEEARVFVDAFHGGALLGLPDCQVCCRRVLSPCAVAVCCRRVLSPCVVAVCCRRALPDCAAAVRPEWQSPHPPHPSPPQAQAQTSAHGQRPRPTPAITA